MGCVGSVWLPRACAVAAPSVLRVSPECACCALGACVVTCAGLAEGGGPACRRSGDAARERLR